MRLQGRVGGRLDPQPVPLEPFGHQVAGQASMLSVDASTVCKPLIPREHQLYCTLPALLRPFTPRYRGVLYVRTEEGDDGSHNLWGYYPNTLDEHNVDNIEIIRGHLFKQGYDDSEHKMNNSKVTKGPWSKKGAQDIDGEVDSCDITTRSVLGQRVQDSAQQVVGKIDSSRIPAHTEPAHTTDNSRVSRRADRREQAEDNKQDTFQISRGGLPDDLQVVDNHEDSRGPVHREDVAEDDGYLQPVTSGLSSGASTPMSSGSEVDLPSAVDATVSPVHTRPSSGCVEPLKEDRDFEVEAGSTAGQKLLITNEDDTVVKTSQGSNPANKPLNPWGLSLHTRLMDKMRKSRPSPSGFPFLMLENVVARFARPCILDLKVGSRLHGDDANQDKIASQSRKCNSTTSRSLGLRLCGMQVYQETGTYKSLDKHHGRTLTDQTFCDVLHDFLHNGKELRTDLLAPILFRLHALLDCLEKLDSFRFYASSLLIMYDGLRPQHISDIEKDSRGQNIPSDKCQEDAHVPSSLVEKDLHIPNSSEENIKGVHVPNSKVKRNVEGVHIPSPKGEQRRRVSGDQCGEQGTQVSSSHGEQDSSDTAVRLLQSARQQQTQAGRLIQPSTVSPPSSSIDLREGGATSKVGPQKSTVVNDNTNRLSPSCLSLVDVRMIDFAHTTHSGFHDNIVHEGPDRDYIWGLQNLTRMFSQLQKEHC